MSQVRVHAIVVAFNGGSALGRCIHAILASHYQPLEILVVDNGGSDPEATAELALLSERVEVVRSQHNLGFAGGVNFAMRWFLERDSRADVYALVNQDCFVRPGWLGPLVATLYSEPSAAVVGSRIYEPDGRTLQHAGGIIHPNGLTDHIGRGCRDDAAYRHRADVDYVTGALCAFRVDAWDRFGPMDAAYYPAYFEEADFCVRARAAGLRVVYIPESEAVHEESTTLGRGTQAQLMAYHRNRMRFAARHLSGAGVRGPAVTSELRWLIAGHGAGQGAALARAYPALAGDLLRSWRHAK